MTADKIRFIVRNVEEKDLSDLYGLARQSSLVSLPPDRSILKNLIQSSLRSFSGQMPRENAVYVFVLEDRHKKKVIGESLVHSSCASETRPYYYFQIVEKTKNDPRLNIEITHQALRLSSETGGVSMCGGLILDREYQSRPEKLGSVIALTRFLYMGMFKDRFNPEVLSEVVAPLSETGSNPFWDAVGKPFTGMDFDRFLELNRRGEMGFAGRLFPKEDIYFCLLAPAVRPSEDRLRENVGRPAKHIIEKVGFRYLKRIHFHGGPILGVNLEEIRLIRKGDFLTAAVRDLPGKLPGPNPEMAFVGAARYNRFTGGHFPVIIRNKTVYLTAPVLESLDIQANETVFVCLSDA